MEEKNVKIKAFIITYILLVATIIGAILFTKTPNEDYSYQVKTFSSYDDLLDFLRTKYENYNNYYQYSNDIFLRAESDNSDSKSSGEGSADYSKTNVQVEGVDEPDIVKTDGTYIYVLAESEPVYIKSLYRRGCKTIV